MGNCLPGHKVLHVAASHWSFVMLCSGLKVVEGCPCRGQFGRVRPGTIIVYENKSEGILRKKVHTVTWYPSCIEMLRNEGILRVYPDMPDIPSGCKIFEDQYPGLMKRGVLAFGICEGRDNDIIEAWA